MPQYYLKHYGIVSDELYSNDFLVHHGISGMRWGKRNGPPYPLSQAKHDKVVESKDSKFRLDDPNFNQYPRALRKALQERDKHSKYTKQEKKALRTYPYFSEMRRNEREAQRKERKYLKNRNKTSNIDPNTKLHLKKDDTSIDNDLEVINIKRQSRGRASHSNCVLCSLAYDLRRRGYDVLANNAVVGYTTPEILRMYKDMKKTAEAKRISVKTDKKTGMKSYSAKGATAFARDISSKTSKFPDKSRGISVLTWAHPENPKVTIGGHCVAWEVINKQFTILDAQVNKKFSGPDLPELYSRINNIEFYRTDNIEPDYEFIKNKALVQRYY